MFSASGLRGVQLATAFQCTCCTMSAECDLDAEPLLHRGLTMPSTTQSTSRRASVTHSSHEAGEWRWEDTDRRACVTQGCTLCFAVSQFAHRPARKPTRPGAFVLIGKLSATVGKAALQEPQRPQCRNCCDSSDECSCNNKNDCPS